MMFGSYHLPALGARHLAVQAVSKLYGLARQVGALSADRAVDAVASNAGGR